MKTSMLLLLCIVMTTANTFAQEAKSNLQKAQKDGKSVFMIVSDKSSTGTDALIKKAGNAAKKAKNTTVVQINRDEKANAEIIAKYRLSGASLPLILVMASNGVVSGSMKPDEASEEKLLKYLPTKTQAEVLFGFENGKAGLIICGKKSSKDRNNLEAECKKAQNSLAGKAIVVFVDIESADEKNFIDLLEPSKDKTTLLVFNGKGQFTGTLESNSKADDIIKAVTKKIGGCSPGSCGSGKKC